MDLKIIKFVRQMLTTVKRFLTFLTFLCLGCLFSSGAIVSQYNFEGSSLPGFVRVNGRGTLELSPDKYKDGRTSLKFSWNGPAQLMFSNSAEMEASMKVNGAGLILWIYNTRPMDQPLLFKFHDWNGGVICQFEFNMAFSGWRAIWMRYDDMLTPEGKHLCELPRQELSPSRLTISIPPSVKEGTIYLDRLSFRTTAFIDQITPDQQIPDNNWSKRERQWQWGRLWEWEQYPEPELKELSAEQRDMVLKVEQRLDQWAAKGNPGDKYTAGTLLPRNEETMAKYEIRRLPDGSVAGKPLLYDDEFNNADGEMRISFIQNLVYWYALDYLYTGNTGNVQKVIDAMDHALDQGFAYGSGWGTNKHYGYQVRNLYKGIWILRKELQKAGKLDDYTRVLMYWSGIQECRKPYAWHRDEILDTWNTLLMSKVIAAMLLSDERARYAYMDLLGEWVGESMRCSDGTLGGIKPDGTSFHHGGHYPAYSVGAFAAVGDFCFLTRDTDFVPSEQGRRDMKKSLLAMQDYCHLRDWGIAVCGRHPLDGAIPDADVQAFAHLAALGDLSGQGGSVDKELAGAYLALGGSDKAYLAEFKKAGVGARAPQDGFRVYNYGAFGIHRRDGWMLSLKGYNSDVWSSEIYAKENRYGRYLSHGTAQLFNVPGAKECGYVREGWDWNRMPGATAIHLPYEELNSPNPGTLMERNSSRFPGVSSLEGMNGCLAFTYVEADRPRFCAGATATKSVFCFDNRILHIGTGITNNSSYPTETTLYQLALKDRTEEVDVNDFYSGAFPLHHSFTRHAQVVLTDTNGNFYIIKDGFGLNVVKQSQTSPSDEMKKDGTGDFITAYIDHGASPQEASYEYLLLVHPSNKQVKSCSGKAPYSVIQADNDAHVVKDHPTGITAYIVYRKFTGGAGTLVREADAETIIMESAKSDGLVVMSVCTPDLGITEKGYTTAQSSQPLTKSLVLEGLWDCDCPEVQCSQEEGRTHLAVRCIDGQPVEFELKIQ